jgi:hypothetical protein
MKIIIIEDPSLEGLHEKISRITIDNIRSRKFGSIFSPDGDVIDVFESAIGKKYILRVADDQTDIGKLLVSPQIKEIFYKDKDSIEV